MENEKNKIINNKPKNKKATIIILITIAIIILIEFSPDPKKKKLDINEIELKEKLPHIDKEYGEINFNDDKELYLNVFSVDKEYFKQYKNEAIADGYIIDINESTNSYKAFNDDGYEISIYLHKASNEMSIELKSPKELKELNWPNSDIAKSLPVPKSKIGTIEWDNSNGFVIYVGETSKDEFNNYIENCIIQGFNLDYKRDDEYYYALNNKGYSITLNYEGNNTMFIRADVKKKENEQTTTSTSTSANRSDSNDKKVGESINCKNFEIKLEKFAIKKKGTRIDSYSEIAVPEWIGVTLTVRNTSDYTYTFYTTQVKIRNSNGEIIEPSLFTYDVWGSVLLNSPELAPNGSKTGYIQFSNTNDDNSDLTLLIDCKDKFILNGPVYSFKLK